MRQVVARLRVSTDKSGSFCPGIAAQRAAIGRFVEAEGREVLGEFFEVATGKGAVLVAKLDRLPEVSPSSPD